MEVRRLNEHTYQETLSGAKETLSSGGVMVAPTDTIYGILGDARNEEAIKKIFALKKRPSEKVFPIFVRDIPVARTLAYISDAKSRFLERIWPGQVTVLFHHKENLPPVLTGGSDKIGIRIPDYPWLLELLQKLDFPLVQTSANISNESPAKDIEEIKKYFDDIAFQPDLVIDAGEIKGASSTVVDFSGREAIVLRSGLVSKEELDRILNIAN
ncbi:MAG: tRNA threonylcarbamoyladenosine biosynthesis protein [Parcubacteria group bacterium Gr01-1014_33]|nr:MAG: tRNA threonylcarbamoyladenosine biosynthesis protein [Parcubacteria group bacterium Gr01-1014_33]